MNTFEQEVARNHARAMEIGERISGPDAAVAPAMLSFKSGLFGLRRKNRTVVAALGEDVLRLQRVDAVELTPDGALFELTRERVESISSSPIDAIAPEGGQLCVGSKLVVRTTDGAYFELSVLDGSGELFKDHAPEARGQIKSAYDAFVAWVQGTQQSA
ncbi:MAG: hypothetical protein JHC98_01645 [Thermoleophilaceae bacterium]|nr:hypothetical protein [Thermoleophilaceae bacterium]